MEYGHLIPYYSDKSRTIVNSGKPEKIACPDGMSEFILKVSAAGPRILPFKEIPSTIAAFYNDIWRRRLTPLASEASKRNKILEAASFSYAGYSYWLAMSTVFFKLEKATGLFDLPAEFEYGSVSGMLTRENN